jgi:hypothetical protein
MGVRWGSDLSHKKIFVREDVHAIEGGGCQNLWLVLVFTGLVYGISLDLTHPGSQ